MSTPSVVSPLPDKTIFLSWQSDTNPGRSFIISALDIAVERLNKLDNKKYNYLADNGCAGDGGSLNIATRMLEKIDNCQLFLADVSIVHTFAEADEKSLGRRAPNPNVMFELGYAVHKLGWKNVILMMNEFFGGPDTLPFDIKQNRVVVFDRPPTVATDAKSKLESLASCMKSANCTQAEIDAIQRATDITETVSEKLRTTAGGTSNKVAQKLLADDLFAAIKATEVPNVGVALSVEKELVAQSVHIASLAKGQQVLAEEHAALERESRSALAFSTAKNINTKNFTAPSPFGKAVSVANTWTRWLDKYEAQIKSNCDQVAEADALKILADFHHAKKFVGMSYADIIGEVSKCSKSNGHIVHHGGW